MMNDDVGVLNETNNHVFVGERYFMGNSYKY